MHSQSMCVTCLVHLNAPEVWMCLAAPAVSDSVTPGSIAHQAPLCMAFPRQEYWSGLPFPSPGDLPDPVIELMSPALQVGSLLLNHQGSPVNKLFLNKGDLK